MEKIARCFVNLCFLLGISQSNHICYKSIPNWILINLLYNIHKCWAPFPGSKSMTHLSSEIRTVWNLMRFLKSTHHWIRVALHNPQSSGQIFPIVPKPTRFGHCFGEMHFFGGDPPHNHHHFEELLTDGNWWI